MCEAAQQVLDHRVAPLAQVEVAARKRRSLAGVRLASLQACASAALTSRRARRGGRRGRRPGRWAAPVGRSRLPGSRRAGSAGTARAGRRPRVARWRHPGGGRPPEAPPRRPGAMRRRVAGAVPDGRRRTGGAAARGAFQAQGGFAGQRRAETVAEQRQGRVGEIAQGEGGAVGEVLQAGSRRLVEAVLATRVLQGKQVDSLAAGVRSSYGRSWRCRLHGEAGQAQARHRRQAERPDPGGAHARAPARGAGARAGPSC